MPQMTAQRPRLVTLDRVCDALDTLGRHYAVDIYESRRTIMVSNPTSTTYIDLCANAIRMRSVWRGVISVDQGPDLLPYVSHHNRESVGPKVISFEHEGHYHLCTQTNLHTAAGLGSQQLEAGILLALIMMERFTLGLEADFDWTSPPNRYFFHHHLLSKQHLLRTPVGGSDNSLTREVTSAEVAQSLSRLGLRTQRNSSVFRLLGTAQDTVVRLFGDDNWMSISTLIEAPTELGSPQLFAAVNQSNAEEAWGVASILGQHPLPYLRFDYLVSVGEGLSHCQLDTEIMSGVTATQDLARRIRAKLQ